MNKNYLISDYTEQEFLEFMQSIFAENSAPTDKVLEALLDQFIRIVEHPESTDLIYYCSEDNCTPESITALIKEWLAANGKPGFKNS